jgi:hypothetical protein
MSKTLFDIRNEEQEKYYPNGLPKITDFKVGDHVKVITPCEDFCFFYGETGKISKCENAYLGITVVFDKPRKFDDGHVQHSFNFNPESLFIINKETQETNFVCAQYEKETGKKWYPYPTNRDQGNWLEQKIVNCEKAKEIIEKLIAYIYSPFYEKQCFTLYSILKDYQEYQKK